MKKFDYTFREGLPGGPNEVKGRVKGSVTKSGYKRNSPDVDNDFNVIPSPYITMVGVDFPVYGEDNLGNGQMMYPGENYEFPGDYVTEMPAYGSGGLTQWFAEEWVDVKTGKKCGRSGKDKNGRPYPACRPSKRVNKTTPKTTKEMSSAEKAKFKKSKTSSKRINYNHKRAQEGIEVGDRFLPPAIRNMQPKEDPIYYDGMLAETTVTAPKYEGPQIRRAYPGETDPINANQMFVGVDRTGGLGALKSLAKGITKIAGVKKAPVLPKYIENVSVGNSDLLMTHAVPKSVSGIKGTKDGVVIAQAAGPKGNHMTLKKFADPAGSQDYYAFTESFIDNPMLAGRAFKMAEDLIPKGSILKQPSSGSLSQDSFNLMTRRLGNPKRFKDFTNYDADYINLNEFGKGRSRIGQDGFTFSQRDFEALNNKYLNYFDELGVPEFRGLGSRQVPILKQTTGYNPYEVNTIRSIKDPRALDKYYQLSVPNITLQKLYRKGGSLYKAQEGKEVLDPRLQNNYNSSDATYVNVNKVDPNILNRSEAQRIIDEAVPQTISSYVEPSASSKALNRLANPFTTAGYIVRGEQIPNRVPAKDNVYDMAADIVNPAAYIDYARQAANNFEDGNVIGGTLNAMAAMPFIPGGADDILRTGKIGQLADDIAPGFKYKPGSGNPYQNLNVTDELFEGVPKNHGEFFIPSEQNTIAKKFLDPIDDLAKELDAVDFDPNWVAPEHLRHYGVIDGRNVVEVAVPGKSKQSQYFYLSSGHGNKAGSGVKGTTQDVWLPFPGYADLLNDLKPGQTFRDVTSYQPKWWMKDDRAEVLYNSKAFKGISDRLHDLSKEAGFDLSGQIYRFQQGGSLYKAQEGGPAGTYTIKAGDTFYGIANRTGIDARTLQFNNPGIDIDKIKPGQVLNVPNLMGPNPVSTQDVVEDKKEEKVKPSTDTYGFNDLLYRQAYQESKFDPTVVSPKGYKGFTQLGKGIMQDYADATGDKRNDPFDPDYAIAVQKWAMDKYINKTNWIKGSDKVKQAKALAAYNWGPGNTVKYLNAQKAKGVDIYSDDLSWIKNMPKETRGYISNILSLDAENNAQWEAAFQRDTTGSKYSDYYKQKGGETLYDYVKGLGYNPTFKNRKQIFGDYFQEEYKGTAKQNIELLNKLKAGDLNIDQYAQKADVQRVAEPVIQQPVQQIQTPLPVQETPTQKSSYRGSTSLSTDEDLNRVRQGLVKRANDIISGKADPYRLPSNVANIVKQQKDNGRYKNPDNYTCIGGVCTLLKSEGVIDEVITSNTEFARVANNSGFSKQSFKLENLKEGDVIQHMGKQNKSGNAYPTHAQMYLGRDEDGNYMFFDNWEITSDKAAADKTKDGLKKYSPEKMETFIKKGQEGRVNGAYFLHLNKEDAYDTEEQTKRARAQKNKARRLPGELYIDENFDGREYDQEVQSSQDIPYIYKGTENANAFEEELVGLFGNSEMDERMKKTFGITEQTLNEIKPYIYGVMAQESNMGVGAKFDDESGLFKNVGRLGRAAKYQAESVVAPTGAGDLSYGPGSVRWSGLRPSVKKQIGKRKNLNNAEGAYFAVADMLLQKANQAERYVGEDINEDLLDQNAWYPALYAYSGQMLGKDKKGNRWGMITGRNRQGQRYSADPGSYPMKVQGYADQLKRFVPIDYEPTIDNYYNPRYVPVVKPKGK